MQNTNIDDSALAYDYESVKRRIIDAKKRSERNEQIGFTNEYISRCVRRYRRAKAGAQKNSIANIAKSAVAFMKGEGGRIVLAGLILLCFAFWIGTTLYLRYAEQREIAFVQKCSENNLRHLRDGICYDKYRHIQTINPDGVAKSNGPMH